MSRLEVRVLGPLRVSRDGVPCEITGRRRRALLAALAVTGRPVPAGELLDAVWEEEPPEGGPATLQTYVSRLRAQLGREAIEHSAGSYRLSAAAVTDVARVRAIVAELRAVGDGAGAARRRAELASSALELWEGRALGELAEHTWFRPAAVELDELRGHLLDTAAEGLIVAGRAADALALLEPQLAAAPLREPTQALAVRALHAAGRTTEALRAADAYRRRLRLETGLMPGPVFVAAEQRALAGEPETVAVPEPPRWSSAALARPTPLVGRTGELAELRTLVATSELVTVVGVGGVGKTRLLAELVAGGAADERWLVVDLAPVEAGDVAANVAAALGYRAAHADAAVVAELLRVESATVVLDNCEHVLADVRGLAREVLRCCTGVRIVATSRTRLDLPHERVLPLDPLPVEGDHPDAVELFVDRFRRARPRDDIDPTDPALGELCRRLDGLPLAVELAASRAAALGVRGLLQRLDRALDLLVDADDSGQRHATLGNVIAWSVDLLGEPAQLLLAALGTFQGPFDLEAAEAVGAAVVDEPVHLLLGRLVDTSLVATDGPDRFRLLQIVRRFARRRLAETERVGEARLAHARWVHRRASAIARLAAGPHEADTVSQLDALRHDAPSALRWTASSGEIHTAVALTAELAGPVLYRPDAELIGAIAAVGAVPALAGAPGEAAGCAAGARAAFLLGDLARVEPLARRALALDPDPASRHRAEHAIGVVRLYQGRFEESVACFEPAATGGELVARLDALGGLALAATYAGDLGRAERALAELGALADAIDTDTYRAFADYAQGEIRLARGEVDVAHRHLVAAAERAWRVGASFVWGVASTVLAAVLVRHRPPAEAFRHLPELLARWRRTATWPQLWTTLRLVAELLAAHSEPELALLVIEAAAHDPAAPRLAGDDAARDAALRQRLADELGDAAVAGIAAAAGSVDRASILERAGAALAQPHR